MSLKFENIVDLRNHKLINLGEPVSNFDAVRLIDLDNQTYTASAIIDFAEAVCGTC